MRSWLWLPRPKPSASVRLYCFAHAGAGASAFASWMAESPPTIEVAAIQLPGRETRLDEKPLRSFGPASQSIALAIQSDSRPFALFGHSAGGRLAIHVASRLRVMDRDMAHIFISASPVTLADREPLHHLDETDFVRQLADRYGPLPAAITDDPEVWSLFGRTLRADFEALETDDVIPRPLDAPLTVIAGRNDTVVTTDELRGWQAWSSGSTRYEIVDADHFSYRTRPKPYLDLIARKILA